MAQSLSGVPRVAFFGGSFDPPHLGHLAVARAAQRALRLDSVLFAPVGAQPLKPAGSSANYSDRLAMTQLAIAWESGFAVSQVDRPKPSGAPNFTVETLQALRAEIPSSGQLFCIMGADSFFGLRRWYRAAEIPFIAPLIVASRPGERLAELEAALPLGLRLEALSMEGFPDGGSNTTPDPDRLHSYLLRNAAGETTPFYLLPDLEVEISASQIREYLRSGHENQPARLLPESVSGYIHAHGLYRS